MRDRVRRDPLYKELEVCDRWQTFSNFLEDMEVCDRWQTFSNFLEDMGERPEGMTLDRIENDKG